MSTNNFTFENICVVVDTNKFDDQYDFDLFFDDARDILEHKVKGFTRVSESKWYNEAYVLGTVDIDTENGTNYATLYITYKDGYYVDGCLDYQIERNEYDFDDELKTYEKKIESKSKVIAKVLRELGTEVIKVGQFSNGEAVYKLA